MEQIPMNVTGRKVAGVNRTGGPVLVTQAALDELKVGTKDHYEGEMMEVDSNTVADLVNEVERLWSIVLVASSRHGESFKSEAEEAQWWDDNQDALVESFQQAATDGQLGHGTVARRGKTPTTTIRLDPEDISKARTQAEAKGLRYQTYLKLLIHEALRQVETQIVSNVLVANIGAIL